MPFFIKQFIIKICRIFGNYPVAIAQRDYGTIVTTKLESLDPSDSLYNKKVLYLNNITHQTNLWLKLTSGPFLFISKSDILVTMQLLNNDHQSFHELIGSMDRTSMRYWKFQDFCTSAKFEIHRDFKQLIETDYDH